MGQRVPGSGDLRLAIGAILRNEAPYLLEWIAFHRRLGIDRFFLADNASDDGTGALLAGLERAGVVRHIPFPDVPGRPPQLPAYDEILRRHGAEADWIAFIDADEFLMPADPGAGLVPLLARLGADPAVGAVAVNWALYGADGQAAPRPGPVIARCAGRAAREDPRNHHFKTILRPDAALGTHETPHLFRLRPGFHAVHADGSPVVPLGGCPGRSAAIVWSPLRLNHYVVKSRDEFFRRKRLRGRATRAGLRPPGFFAAHDRNDEREPADPRLVAAVLAEKRALIARLEAPPSAPPSAPPPARGRIDGLAAAGQVARLRGWAFDAARDAMVAFLLDCDGRPVELLDRTRIERPDVAARFPGADPAVGFELSFAWEPLEGAPESARLRLRAVPAEGEMLALAAEPGWTGLIARARAACGAPPPALPAAEAALLAAALAGARHLVDYGAGAAAAQALAEGRDLRITVVDSDRLRLAALRDRLGAALRPERHRLRHVDLGPVAADGMPATAARARDFPSYALAPWQEAAGGTRPDPAPDLVVVAGRFRRACLLAALIHAAPGCRILVAAAALDPDFPVAPDAVAGRLAALTVPAARPDGLWPAFLAACGDPLR